ncbi:hypothetical protein GUJ93_ZPchr0008g12736 [Zizania palustris]|nr:hypothetical protein GUJ93_ZPchr0008g12736 [Zizania palustris]
MDSFEQHLGSQSEPDPCQELVVANEAVQPDDDERLYPELVENWGTFGRDAEDDIVAQFDDTDEEEKEENNVMGVDEHEEIEDRPIISYDRENPSLTEGSIFPSIVDCRNALATFCIRGEFDFDIDKSDQTRLTVHCTYSRLDAAFGEDQDLGGAKNAQDIEGSSRDNTLVKEKKRKRGGTDVPISTQDSPAKNTRSKRANKAKTKKKLVVDL